MNNYWSSLGFWFRNIFKFQSLNISATNIHVLDTIFWTWGNCKLFLTNLCALVASCCKNDQCDPNLILFEQCFSEVYTISVTSELPWLEPCRYFAFPREMMNKIRQHWVVHFLSFCIFESSELLWNACQQVFTVGILTHKLMSFENWKEHPHCRIVIFSTSQWNSV